VKLPAPPRITPVGGLLLLTGIIMVSSVMHTRESLLFCERALFSEMNTIAKEGTADKPLKFSDVCPDVRARAEAATNRLLDITLALMVQFTGHGGPPPLDRP
jgi:hypothetical protein